MRKKHNNKAFSRLQITRKLFEFIKFVTGFTLVEIMVVITILGILAAITIPNLLRARHNANESAAIASLRTISTAEENYRAAQTPPTYTSDLNSLTIATPPYIDSILAGATSSANARQGYYYTYSLLSNYQYTCTATPETSGLTGTRIFYVDESGVLRVNNSVGLPVE